MSRWKASAIHLAISALVAIAVVLVIAFVWFPGPLFEATGSRELVVLLIAIDVTIGPIITLIVYREGKRGMKFDLAVIAFCQLAALAYGLHAFLAMRPVFNVFAVDRFVMVPASVLDPADLADAKHGEFATLSWTGPKLVAARMPTDREELMKLMDSGLAGKDIERFPKYFEPYESMRSAVLAKALPLERVVDGGGAAGTAVTEFLARRGENAAGFAYLPLVIPPAHVMAIIRRSDAGFVGIVPVEPPKLRE